MTWGRDLDVMYRRMALYFLNDYELTPLERAQEAERLAQSLQATIEAELENLEHRRKTGVHS